MRTLLVALALVAAATPARSGEFEAWGPAIARHELKAMDGTPFRIAELEGDIVVVNFWASWCRPCKQELRALDAWTREPDGEGVRIVAVSIDQHRANAVRFLEREEIGLTVFHDGPQGLAAHLDLPALPCTVVMDGAGRVVRVDQGGVASLPAIRREVQELRAAQRRGAGVEG